MEIGRRGSRGSSPRPRPSANARYSSDAMGIARVVTSEHTPAGRPAAATARHGSRDWSRHAKIRIVGGRPLEGTVRISGARTPRCRTSARTLLTAQTVASATCPRCATSAPWAACWRDLGRRWIPGRRHRRGHRPAELTSVEAPYDLVKTMRASVLVLGPLLARRPGAGLAARRLRHRRAPHRPAPAGAREDGGRDPRRVGYVEAAAERLRGAEIDFDTVTVTGTENVMMAATLADGETVIRNAAREPEIEDLADLL